MSEALRLMRTGSLVRDMEKIISEKEIELKEQPDNFALRVQIKNSKDELFGLKKQQLTVREQVDQIMVGNGSEVMKAVAELRAELSEKDMAAIDEELKERLNIVPDPAVPEGEVWVLDKNKYLAECRKRAYSTMKDIGDPDVYLRDLRGDVV